MVPQSHPHKQGIFKVRLSSSTLLLYALPSPTGEHFHYLTFLKTSNNVRTWRCVHSPCQEIFSDVTRLPVAPVLSVITWTLTSPSVIWAPPWDCEHLTTECRCFPLSPWSSTVRHEANSQIRVLECTTAMNYKPVSWHFHLDSVNLTLWWLYV